MFSTKSTDLEGPAVDFGVKSVSVIDGGFATPERLAKLKSDKEAIEKRTYAEIIKGRDESRSAHLAVNTTLYDEAAAAQQLSTISPPKVSSVVKQYEVKLTEGKPLTKKDLFKILFSDKPTNPLVITRQPGGVPVPRETDKKEYKEAVKALRMSCLGEDEEVDQLFAVKAAIELGDPKILDNYFEVVEQKHKDSQLNIGNRVLGPLAVQKECLAVLDDAKRRFKYRNIIIAGAVIAAVLAAAAAIVLTVFVPPVGATILGFLTAIGVSVVKGVKEYFSGTLGPTATAAVTTGSIVGVGGVLELGFGYRRKSNVEKLLEKCNTLVAEEEVKEKVDEARIKEIEAKRAEARQVFEAIEQESAQDQPLVLNSCAGALVAIRDPRARFQKITLAVGVGKKDTKLLRDALAINFTVTELTYNYSGPVDEKPQNAFDDIARQLLMNRYLQGEVLDEESVKNLFGDIENLRKQTIEKVKSNFDLTEFPVPIAPELQEEVRKVMEQNRLLAQISQQSTATDWRRVFEVDYQRAYKALKGADKDDGIYTKLRQELNEQRAKAKASGNTADIARLDIMLQEDLKMRYPCLSQVDLVRDVPNIEKLENELKSNRDLRSSEFIGAKANHAAREVVEFRCHLNLLMDALEKSDLKSFIENYSLIPAGRCEEVLKEIGTEEDKLKILQLMVVVNDSKEKNIALTCENLRKLNQQGGLTMLLEHCYSLNDTASDANKKGDAYKKAELISALLNIPELFDPPDNKDKQAIKYEIYWATTPFGSWMGSKDVPYYKLSYLESNLQKIPASNPYKAKLAEAMQPKVKPPESGIITDKPLPPAVTGKGTTRA